VNACRQARLAIGQPHHRPITTLVRDELEHVGSDAHRILRDQRENVFRSKVTARSMFGRARPATNSR
jgi:hypothetical protein